MFAEFACLTNFTFLTGASHPEDYVHRALVLGMGTLAVADENSVAGIVRAHVLMRDIGRRVRERQAWDRDHDPIGPPRPAHIPAPESFPIDLIPRLIPAARLVLTDAPDVIALPRTRVGWGQLSRLLSKGRLRAEKGACFLHLADVLDHAEDLHLLLVPHPQQTPCGAYGWGPHVDALSRRFAGRMHLMLAPTYDGGDTARFRDLTALALRLGLPTLASAAPRMHHGGRRRLADVLSAIRLGCRVEALGRSAQANGEQRLRSEAEMRAIFVGYEDAVDRAGADP